MLGILLYGAVLVFALVMLLRVGMMMTGRYKSPLLAQFEKYGGDELRFNPYPALVGWSGLALMSGYESGRRIIAVPEAMPQLGLLLSITGLALYIQPALRAWLAALAPRPPWYRHLMDMTTRIERRRLAYMWLRLPRRTRLRYNVNDRAFFQWAELIIMATDV